MGQKNQSRNKSTKKEIIMKLTQTLLLGLVNAQVFNENEDYDSYNADLLEDFEHKKQIQSLLIKDFDASMPKLLETLFATFKRRKSFRDNQQVIARQDKAFCESGFDDFGNRVRCRDDVVIKIDYQTPEKKYRQLKMLAAWLEDDNDFEKYSYYGCHCFPTGAEEMDGGHGEPMDGIDRGCKLFFQCYECAKLGNGQVQGDAECDGLSQKYSLRLNTHLTTFERSMSCVDDEGSCARNICECDKRLVEHLASNRYEYSEHFHTGRNNGTWAYNNECKRRNSEKKYGKATECCGESFPDMIPKQEGKQCCGHRPFDPLGSRKCCEANRLRPEC